MNKPRILINLRQSAWLAALILGFGCASKHDKKDSPTDSSEQPRNRSFLDACLSSTASDGTKNLVRLVLEHSLVASQNCSIAAGKLEKLDGLGLGTSPNENVEVDLSPLAELTNLKELGLFHLKVKDLTPISGLPLKSLILTSNELSDLSPLSNILGMETLLIANNPITSLAPLARMPLNLFSLDFIENSLGLDEATCPTAAGTNPEIRGECLVRRSNGPLWVRQLVGSWVEGSDTIGHTLHIDEQGRYELAFHGLKNGKQVDLIESGSLDHADWLEPIGMDGLRFLPDSSNCMTSLSSMLGRDNQGLAGFKRELADLTIQFKKFEVKFHRGQPAAKPEKLPCPIELVPD